MIATVFKSLSKKILLIRQSAYFKNVLVLMSGAGISQAILIISAPLLTRLYEPSIFGEYEVFSSTVALLMSLVFLNYDLGIYTEKGDSKAINALAAATVVLLCICCLIFIFLFLGKHFFVKFFGYHQSDYIQLYIPCYLLFAGGYNLLLTWFTKFGRYKIISFSRILLSVIIVILQLGFGLLKWGYWGLIISTTIVQLITFIVLLFPFLKYYKNSLQEISIRNIKEQIVKNKQFPTLVLPGNALNNLTQNLPAFFLARIDSQVLGYYGLSRRIIGFPLSFISSAVQKIFMKDASDEFTKTGAARISYKRNMYIFAFVAAVLFVFILLLSERMVPLIFGQKWRGATLYFMVLSVFYLIRFISGGLSFIMVFGTGPKIDIFWQIGLFLTSLLSLYLPIKFSLTSFYVVLIFVISMSLFYMLYILQSYKFANSGNGK